MLNVVASETTLELTRRFVNYCCKKFLKIGPGPEVNLPRHHNSKPDSAGADAIKLFTAVGYEFSR